MKKCPREERKSSLEARDKGGSILNDGGQDGDMDEFRSYVCVNVVRSLKWREYRG